MGEWSSWSRRSKALFGGLSLYALLLFSSSGTALFTAVRSGWDLKWDDFFLEALMLLFLPMLVIGLFKTRAAALLLFAGVAADLALLVSLSGSTGDGIAAAILGSALFLGAPMLVSGWFFYRLRGTGG